jgi:glutaconyl-CoA/methylmalonyl-CoA decarboxylase subunit gamma
MSMFKPRPVKLRPVTLSSDESEDTIYSMSVTPGKETAEFSTVSIQQLPGQAVMLDSKASENRLNQEAIASYIAALIPIQPEAIQPKELKAREGVLQYQNRLIRYYAVIDEGVLTLWIAGQVYRFEMLQTPCPDKKGRPENRKENRKGNKESTENSKRGSSGSLTLVAPMPGSILSIAVQQGDTVEAGQCLMMMESMKMELTLSAECAATVAKINCKPGQQVALNDVLIQLS